MSTVSPRPQASARLRSPQASLRPGVFSAIRLAALIVAMASGAASTPARGQAPRAAPLSPAQKAFADECETLRRGTILKLEESLRGLKSGRLVVPDVPGTIRQTEADISALRTNQRVIIPMLRFPPRVGAIGRFPGGGAYIEQVLGPSEALVRGSFHVNVVVTRNKQSVAEVVHQRPLFKIRGVSTADWEESTDVELLSAFEVSGTERYKTVDGQMATVQILKPFDMRPIEDYLRRQSAN
jgi:hypothetical protein